jgi:hypothetical protein
MKALVVEKALERNPLTSKIISLCTMETSFSAARTLGHNLQITAILKLSKLAVCSISTNYNTVF